MTATSAEPAQPPRLIPRTVLFGNPQRTPPRISPDGRLLAWTAPRNGLLNLFVAPVDDLAKARPLTDERQRPVQDYNWSPDSRMILYPRDAGGDENDHVMCVHVEGGQARDLTPFRGAKAAVMKMSHAVKDRILVSCNKRDPGHFDIYSLDLATGTLDLKMRNEVYARFVADTRLELRLAERPRLDGGSDYFRVVDGKVEETPFERIDYEDARGSAPVGFSGDGKTLYWVDSRGRDTTALVAQDFASGEKRLLGADARADIHGVVMHPTSATPLAYQAEYLKPGYVAFDESVRADFAHIDATLEGVWTLVSQDAANETWTLVNDPVTAPPAAFLYRRAGRQLHRLYVIRPDLEGMPLVPMHPLELKARDGLTLVSYLSLPPGVDVNRRPAKPLPLVLCVHGGPWSRKGYAWEPTHQWLANRGYAALWVNFRGSTGFGKSFVVAGDREWGGKMQDDLHDALDAMIARGLVDPSRVAILGGSYGGYATLVGLSFTPKKFTCGVDIVGLSQLTNQLASIPPYWAAEREMFRRAIGDPDTPEGRKLLRDRSPLYRAAAIERPLLIGQGANDPRVHQSESDQIVRALAANRTPVTYVVFPDEGHVFERPANRIAFWAVTENFLATWLGGRAEPVGDGLAGSSAIVPTGAEHVPGLREALAKAPSAPR